VRAAVRRDGARPELLERRALRERCRRASRTTARSRRPIEAWTRSSCRRRRSSRGSGRAGVAVRAGARSRRTRSATSRCCARREDAPGSSHRSHGAVDGRLRPRPADPLLGRRRGSSACRRCSASTRRTCCAERRGLHGGRIAELARAASSDQPSAAGCVLTSRTLHCGQAYLILSADLREEDR
jgi:hypothetical protein